MPTRRMCTTTQNIGHYFRMTPDDRLLFGGRARFALSSATSDAKSGAILEAGLSEVFPSLAGTRLDWCWGGIVDMTQDRLPRVPAFMTASTTRWATAATAPRWRPTWDR